MFDEPSIIDFETNLNTNDFHHYEFILFHFQLKITFEYFN